MVLTPASDQSVIAPVGISCGMRPKDTSPEIHQLQTARYRALSPEQRAEIAAELSHLARAMAEEGIRLRHPQYSEQEVRRALLHLLYNKELARMNKKS
jgi:hypothetical protein